MEDSILDSAEFDFASDDEVALIKGGFIHKHTIPILLSPKVVFPFQITHPIVADAQLKEIFRQAYEEKTVIGYLYHPADSDEKLPKIGQVGTSAIVGKLEKTTNGSYLLKIVPINRFYTDEYITTDKSNLLARVKYYWDAPEDDTILKPLEAEYKKLLRKTGELIQSKTFENVMYENDRELISFYIFTFIRNHPNLSEPEKLYLLWMYKLSDRLRFSIEILKDALPKVQRAINRIVPYKDN